MKFSVITWDGNFREHTHTIDIFSRQCFPQDEFEFIWVDYYDSNPYVRKKLERYPNFYLITLSNPEKDQWHLGKCINAGVKYSSGDILVIPDGDIVVEPDFLSYVWDSHQRYEDLALYFRRFDEPQNASCDQSRYSIDYLKQVSTLMNATNYAGCLTLRRTNFDRVNGYESHPVFAGPGSSALELFIRLRNAGMLIKWAPDKRIYHPWHKTTGNIGHNDINAFRIARQRYNWIIPGARIEQSWIMHCRGLSTNNITADETICENLLAQIPNINMEYYRNISNSDKIKIQLTQKDDLLEHKSKQLAHCENILANIQESIFWRITTPFRRIYNAIIKHHNRH